MKNLFSTLFAVAVACATAPVLAQAPAAAPKAAASAAQPGPVSKSVEARVAMCMGCHSIKGYQASFPEVHKVPMIAGQSAKYIVAALNGYKNGDRKHPTMRAIAGSLSDQDIADVADYYAKLGGDAKAPAQPSKQPDAQVAALLQKAACASCHGANFSLPIDVYPKIAGQHADYLFVALKAYKQENNQAVGRSNGVMGAIAKQFSHAELKALANYMGSLDGDLKTVPESRFHTH
ncbi:c-type cytochrome [Ramlibacter sp. PS4R-6]|uniref:c-type cytochrome n=1 Tax=Ramlibacter sp. PS4R-6 TaxID=3133438 RepID=UPI0030A70114